MTDKNVYLKDTDGFPSTSVNVEWAITEAHDLVKRMLPVTDDFEALLQTLEANAVRTQHSTVLVQVYALALLGKATGAVIHELQGRGMEWADIMRKIELSMK